MVFFKFSSISLLSLCDLSSLSCMRLRDDMPPPERLVGQRSAPLLRHGIRTAQVLEQRADKGYAGGILGYFLAFEWLHCFERSIRAALHHRCRSRKRVIGILASGFMLASALPPASGCSWPLLFALPRPAEVALTRARTLSHCRATVAPRRAEPRRPKAPLLTF